MLSRAGIPVRQHDHSLALLSLGIRRRRKPLAVDDVIRRIRSPHRGGESQQFAVELKIRWRLVAEEVVAILDAYLVQLAKILLRSVPVPRMTLRARPVLRPLNTPFK